MLRKTALFAGCAVIVIASFMFTNSVIDRGFTATLTGIWRLINP